MFVVAPIQRKHNPDGQGWDSVYSVVFEDTAQASTTGPIANRESREAAQKLADALNKALNS